MTRREFEEEVGIGIDPDSKLIAIPGTKYRMGQTQVTQRLYEKVMGENPSWFQRSNDKLDDGQRNILEDSTDNNPVENVSWFDAVCFCNKLSILEGLTPAYSVGGETNPDYWNYTSFEVDSKFEYSSFSIESEVCCDFDSNGYRLPTIDEWKKAARGGEDYRWSGSDDLDKVGWYKDNSGKVTHPVAQKMANSYGLYDMSGNVWEWVWGEADPDFPDLRFFCGGSYSHPSADCEVSFHLIDNACRCHDMGFRILRPIN